MRKLQKEIELSASDLSNYIACRHLTFLDLSVANGLLEHPKYRDPMLAVLQERGLEFEQAYLRSLKEKGFSISEPGSDDDSIGVQRTIKAMREGVDYIYQASLKKGVWQGKADFLQKVRKHSNFGEWSYE